MRRGLWRVSSRSPPVADIAQLVEQVIRNDQVIGSSPIVGSILLRSPERELVSCPKFGIPAGGLGAFVGFLFLQFLDEDDG